MAKVVMNRPRSEVEVSVKKYVGADGTFKEPENEVSLNLTALRTVMRRSEIDINVIDTLDAYGANYGYAFGPTTLEGTIAVRITDEKSGRFMRTLIDTIAISDFTFKDKPGSDSDYTVLRDVIVKNENLDIGSTLNDIPVVSFDISALTLERYVSGALVDTVGDGWERVAANERPQDYNQTW